MAAAWWLTAPDRRRAAAAVAAAALGPVAALAVLFPDGGSFPFAPSAFWPTLGATGLTWLALGREHRLLRTGALLYAAVLVVAFAVPTPMGGNATRLGALLAGPLLAFGADRRLRRWSLVALGAALVYWPWSTAVDDVRRAQADPSVRSAYYAGLLGFLEAQPGPFRVEVPFTDDHWESARLGEHVPLARGWERQTDRRVNALFYGSEPLTAARYRDWLRALAVGYVALPDAPLDPSAAREADLIRAGQPWLVPVWSDRHWRVFRVEGARPLADGAAKATALGVDAVDLRFAVPGRSLVRVRWSPYWALVAGRGCVGRAGPWLAVDARDAGTVRLGLRLALARVRATRPRCAE